MFYEVFSYKRDPVLWIYWAEWVVNFLRHAFREISNISFGRVRDEIKSYFRLKREELTGFFLGCDDSDLVVGRVCLSGIGLWKPLVRRSRIRF